MGLVERLVSKEALQEARAEGAAQARAEAQAETLGNTLLRLLDARDIPLNRSTRERILACRDLALVDRWFDRALRAHSLEEVLGEPARRRTQRRSATRGARSKARIDVGK